ncbi:MAG: hypothetical protein RL264_2513 [Bacteroidota bacterium]|jgi:pSer/pThr/pTyr-binding forkhead associated (FHA) protein
MEKMHLRIGSAADNDLQIDSPNIDPYHVELYRDSEGNVFISDLNSKFGTFVNNAELSGFAQLREGDKVILGQGYILRWEKFAKKEAISSTSAESPREKTKEAPKKKLEEVEPVLLSSEKNDKKLNKELYLIYGIVIFLFIVFYILL